MAKAEKWVVLATAPDQLTAEIWQDILRQQGIPVMINPQDAISFLGVSTFPCRIMVYPSHRQRAKKILASLQPQPEEGE